MDMSHCEYARDEADDNSMSAFEHFLKTPGSKELSLSNSLFSSPVRQSSTSLSGWPLQTIHEEKSDEQDLLSCLEDSVIVMQGATPQDIHANAVKYRLMKSSLPAVQLMLLEYPQFGAWEMKHEPIEKVVQLQDHPAQQQIFNSWVELHDSIKPTTAQTPVRMHVLQFIVFGCKKNQCAKDCGVCMFCPKNRM